MSNKVPPPYTTWLYTDSDVYSYVFTAYCYKIGTLSNGGSREECDRLYAADVLSITSPWRSSFYQCYILLYEKNGQEKESAALNALFERIINPPKEADLLGITQTSKHDEGDLLWFP